MKSLFLFLVVFILTIFIIKAEVFEYPVDCDDNPVDDPQICHNNPGYDCNDPKFSVCSDCIHAGAEEICDDGIDNNCNLDEPLEGWDNEDATGNDERDISCCDIYDVVWKDSKGKIIENKEEVISGRELIIEINGSSGCYNQNVDLKVWDEDVWPDKDDAVTTEDLTTTFINLNDNVASAIKTWIVEWEDLDLVGNPEYYVNATPEDSGRGAEKSTLIKVLKPSKGCEIDYVEWTPSSCLTDYEDGHEFGPDDEVTLTVQTKGTTCNEGNKIVEFKLMEYDFGIWNDDDLSGKEGFIIEDVRVENYKAQTTWTVKYDHPGQDDDGVPIENLQYYFTAQLGTQKVDSDRATIRACDLNDKDCDNICDSSAGGTYCECKEDECDTCLNTPACAQDLDPSGCSEDQRECLIYWNCPAEWVDHCDEETPKWTRDTSSCTVSYPDEETRQMCEGLNIKPATQKGCVITEEFPVFTGFNILIVILLLSFYYAIDKTKKVLK